ncbi:piggyBac transposable element-derived protein 4-like [Ctenocephalides felis]|uniref:piggyBac transposable element-derived protein 4-like n=1 Tax=Ctenocephalides felis TaxID=7515 RepID=UPI000E6E43A4|nr:piggyBac transposable element-derived protein 4-like [Ctenocephalides felis]
MDLDCSDCSSTSTIISLESERELDFDDEIEFDGWTEIDISTNTPQPQTPFEFMGNSSINEDVALLTTPLQFFNYFFDDELVGKIVEETNVYFIQEQRTEPSTSGAVMDWNVTAAEMRIFFAIVLNMSIVYKPDENMYWSKNPIIATPFFSKVMSNRRFKLIKKYLHFMNNETYNSDLHPYPKLNKIWPVYDFLNKKFKTAYTLQREITIDESLMLYKGALSWKQYMPMKRARFGIKSYFLCESKTGYIWSMMIYTGKGTIIDSEFPNLPISSQIVMSLMKPLINKGYCLTIDNFYSSVELFKLLSVFKTDAYGTVRSNRKGLPINIKIQKK